MTIMRPPQRGQGQGNTRASSAARLCSSAPFTGGGKIKNSRARATVRGPVAVGKQAIMADAVEPFWQDVHEEAANELVGMERHRLPAIGAIKPIVLPAEGDATIVGGDEAPVGDGDAMRVA